MPAKYPCGSVRRPVACPPPSVHPPSVMSAIGSFRAVGPGRRLNPSPRPSAATASCGRRVSAPGATLDDLRLAPEAGRPPGIPGRVELPGRGAPLGDLGGDDGGDVGAAELAARRRGGPEPGGATRDVLATAAGSAAGWAGAGAGAGGGDGLGVG